jgi:hypothetical protein
MSEINDRKEFEERADFIDNEDLLLWTVENEHFREIQQQLLAKGAKLLAGPRGSGKTHHMKVAYYRALKTETLAIYVSFGKYYHLEPILYKSPRAFHIFHTWILGKILLGCQQLITDLNDLEGNRHVDLNIVNKFPLLDDFVSQTEKGIINEEHAELIARLTILEVEKTLETLADMLGKKKIILFLDDAALTLTPDYMREFFDVFRSLKSSRISPKASVYPGTTEYSPRFHIGEDAEKVDCWPNVEDRSYSDFMDQFIEKRFPTISNSIPNDIIDLLKYASFGIPRAFINLIRSFEESKKRKGSQEAFNAVIDEQAALIKAEYRSYSQKRPQYKTIIGTGDDLFEKITDIVTEENRAFQKNGRGEKQITIGIQQKQAFIINISRMIKFLIEAGLLFPLSSVKHGSSNKREYERYIPHLLFLIKKRAFSAGRGFNAGQIVEFIRRESAKHPVRRTVDNLLDKNRINNIKLDLPPCTHCGKERLSEDQKFCHHCGRQLVEKSRFEECMKISIDDLPLPEWQKHRLKEQTTLKKIEDIISHSDPGSELQKARQVGPKRSEKIVQIAKKYVEEFLA